MTDPKLKPALSFHVSGIKCDNPKCNYRDPDARLEDYEKYLNQPCPKCGEILLTEKDQESVKQMIALTNAFQDILVPKDTPMTESKVHMKGDGTVKIEILPHENNGTIH